MTAPNSSANLILSSRDQARLAVRCEKIAVSALGTPNPHKRFESKQTLNRDGTYAKIARTAFINGGAILGHGISFDLFRPEEKLVHDDEFAAYDGDYFTLYLDTIGQDITKVSHFALMEVVKCETVTITPYTLADMPSEDANLPAFDQGLERLFSAVDTSDVQNVLAIRDLLKS